MVLITPVKHLGQYFHLLTSQKNIQTVFTQGSKKYLTPGETAKTDMLGNNKYCYNPSFFLLYKICTIDTHFDCPPKNPYSLHHCSIGYSLVHRSIALYQTVD